jgi:hypothetical protein
MLAVAFCLCLPSRQQEVDDGGKRYFQLHDSNRDGMLDLDECMRALQVNWPPAALLACHCLGGKTRPNPFRGLLKKATLECTGASTESRLECTSDPTHIVHCALAKDDAVRRALALFVQCYDAPPCGQPL